MKNFADTPRTSGTFPDVVSIPDTSPGSKDGTPLHKNYIDDFFGMMQAALQGAHMSPDSNPEAAGATQGDITGSQIMEALSVMFQPAGCLVGIFSDTIPAGARLLKLDGQVILRADFERLIDTVEIAYGGLGSAFYRCTAGGVPDPGGDYMKLPDMKGQFVRGRDTAGTVDPDGASRNYGDKQGDALQKHNHVVENKVDGTYQTNGSAGTDGVPISVVVPTGSPSGAKYQASDVEIGADIDPGFTQITGNGAVDPDETRPTNFIVQWCITY